MIQVLKSPLEVLNLDPRTGVRRKENWVEGTEKRGIGDR